MKKYEYARNFLLRCGYEQETHVRYKLKNSQGGYIQKENHWKQQKYTWIRGGCKIVFILILIIETAIVL